MENKILFVIPKLCNGGAERRVAFLANSFSGLGYDVSVLSFWETDGDYALDEKIRRLHLSDKLRFDHHASDKKRMLELRGLMRKAKPNIVFTMHPPVAMMVGIAGFAIPFKAIDLVEVSPNHMQHMKRRIFGWKRSDIIMLQCEKQLFYMDKKFKNKCRVVYNPVDQKFLDASKSYDNKIIEFINVGRLDPEKNHPLLLQAFKAVHEKHREIRLTIFGKGPQKDNVIKFAHELSLDNIVTFVDRSSDMVSDYAKRDAFILSSDFEGMPNALLEAMATGLPSISTNCDTGPSDIIADGENGILVPIGDKEKLAEAIEKFVNNPDQAIRMGKLGKETIRQKFAEDIIIKEYKKVVDSLLK
ncbi:MAG: glycosyltransferase [Bacilli bacterium]|jgi:glycosyltransferase involved in cell wall biosynthesis